MASVYLPTASPSDSVPRRQQADGRSSWASSTRSSACRAGSASRSTAASGCARAARSRSPTATRPGRAAGADHRRSRSPSATRSRSASASRTRSRRRSSTSSARSSARSPLGDARRTTSRSRRSAASSCTSRATRSSARRRRAGSSTSKGGNPDARAFIGFIFEPSIGDRDGDGIKDDVDKCPDDPEDFDASRTRTAAPIPTTTATASPTSTTSARTSPETKNGYQDEDGCPDGNKIDRDGDGIPDDVDKCPDDPEDMDGFQDADGCPDPTTTRTASSTSTTCARTIPRTRTASRTQDGCPDPDNDKDRILDKDDKCPNEPETYNGYQDEDGCPDNGRVVVNGQVDRDPRHDLLRVRQGDHQAGSRTRSSTRSRRRCKGNPQIQLIEIQGHADERGDDAYNLDLTDRRAHSVREYLIDKGVDDKRLQAQGYGETQPMDPRHNRGVGDQPPRRVRDPQARGRVACAGHALADRVVPARLDRRRLRRSEAAAARRVRRRDRARALLGRARRAARRQGRPPAAGLVLRRLAHRRRSDHGRAARATAAARRRRRRRASCSPSRRTRTTSTARSCDGRRATGACGGISTAVPHDRLLGLGGSAETDGGGAMLFAPTGPVATIDVAYLAQPHGGALEVTADGKVVQTLDTTGDQQPGFAHVALPDGAKKIELRAHGRVRLFGATLEARDAARSSTTSASSTRRRRRSRPTTAPTTCAPARAPRARSRRHHVRHERGRVARAARLRHGRAREAVRRAARDGPRREPERELPRDLAARSARLAHREHAAARVGPGDGRGPARAPRTPTAARSGTRTRGWAARARRASGTGAAGSARTSSTRRPTARRASPRRCTMGSSAARPAPPAPSHLADITAAPVLLSLTESECVDPTTI